MRVEVTSDELVKNRNFTQVYPKGWQRIRALSKLAPSAIGLYSFFAEHIDPSCGAVLCDQSFLAETFGVTRKTINVWIALLEEQGAIVKIPIVGRVCAYALNPNEVWKGYATSKDYAAFVTKTLVNKDESIQRRLKLMIEGQMDLPLDGD